MDSGASDTMFVMLSGVTITDIVNWIFQTKCLMSGVKANKSYSSVESRVKNIEHWQGILVGNSRMGISEHFENILYKLSNVPVE